MVERLGYLLRRVFGQGRLLTPLRRRLADLFALSIGKCLEGRAGLLVATGSPAKKFFLFGGLWIQFMDSD